MGKGGVKMPYPEDFYWLWFSLLPGVGSRRGRILLGEQTSPEKLWQRDQEELDRIRRINEIFCQKIYWM